MRPVVPGLYLRFRSAFASAGENGIDLLEGKSFNRIIAIYINGNHVDACRQKDGIVAKLLIERLDLRLLCITAHGTECCGTIDEGGDGVRRAFRINGCRDAWIELLEFSVQSWARLFIVSEPTVSILPATPLLGL